MGRAELTVSAVMSSPPPRRPRLLVLYHFFHPDRVVSARIFSDFAAEQARRGWDVTALTTNRSLDDASARYPRRGDLERREASTACSGRRGRRSARCRASATAPGRWRPGSRARCSSGRSTPWSIGSDPSFAASLAIPLRAAWPRTPLLHWCLDVFPDAGEAEWTGATRLLSPPARAVMSAAYRCCDVVVDLGPCMRRRLEAYGGSPARETLTPWALVEPEAPAAPDPAVRRELFGDAAVGLLYAGSMSRSHDFDSLLELARACRARAGNRIALCFACTGTNLPALKAAVRPEDTNVRFAPFADEAAIQRRFEAADFHLGSLRPDFTGIVVPSKFFAALAVGAAVHLRGRARTPPSRAGSASTASGWCWSRAAPTTWSASARRAGGDPPACTRARRRAGDLPPPLREALINDRWAALLARQLRRSA